MSHTEADRWPPKERTCYSHRTMRVAPLLALFATACAPSLAFNQTFLTPEEVKLAPNGYASLRTTGESFDLGPIKAQEKVGDRLGILKVHGAYILVGDGFQHA